MTISQNGTEVNNYSEPLLPQDNESERRTLSGCLIGAAEHAIANIIPIVKPEHFFRRDHRLIYEALLEIYRNGKICMADELRDRLASKGELEEIGGVAYIASIFNSDYSAVNIEFYAGKVLNNAILRKIIQASGEMKTAAYNPGAEPSEVIEQAEKTIMAATSDLYSSETINLKKTVEQVISEIKQREKGKLRGLPTGFFELDRKLPGLKNGELIVLGGRTSVGKTAIALNLAEHMAVDENIPVAYISLEMSGASLVERILIGRGHIDSDQALGGDLDQADCEIMERVGEEIASAPLYIEPPFDMTPLQLTAKVRRLVMRHGIRCLFIDYLQQLRSPPGKQTERYLQIGQWTRCLKLLALELNIPVVILSQLNRASDEQHRPYLSSLRESGNIEQDADVVLLLWRDKDSDETEVIIAKNRNGPTGTVKLKWVGEWMRFTE